MSGWEGRNLTGRRWMLSLAQRTRPLRGRLFYNDRNWIALQWIPRRGGCWLPEEKEDNKGFTAPSIAGFDPGWGEVDREMLD
jgi:hypothetical protein